MSNQELLASISIMLDEKFEGIYGKFEGIDERFKRIDARFEQIDARFEQIDARFEQIDARFEQIDARFERIDARFEQIDARFEQMDERFEALEEELSDVKFRVKRIEIIQENKILPLLNDVVSCYCDTFERYQRNADKMEQTFEDVALLKETVAEHSVLLQRLA